MNGEETVASAGLRQLDKSIEAALSHSVSDWVASMTSSQELLSLADEMEADAKLLRENAITLEAHATECRERAAGFGRKERGN